MAHSNTNRCHPHHEPMSHWSDTRMIVWEHLRGVTLCMFTTRTRHGDVRHPSSMSNTDQYPIGLKGCVFEFISYRPGGASVPQVYPMRDNTSECTRPLGTCEQRMWTRRLFDVPVIYVGQLMQLNARVGCTSLGTWTYSWSCDTLLSRIEHKQWRTLRFSITKLIASEWW